jgi:hypothetical protein
MTKKIDLRLSITETESIVELNLISANKKLINFINEALPSVKVPYFKQPRISREQLVEVSEREAADYSDGQQGVLNHYIYCREKETYQYVLELRKTMRKLVMATESANIAKSVLKELTSKRTELIP